MTEIFVHDRDMPQSCSKCPLLATIKNAFIPYGDAYVCRISGYLTTDPDKERAEECPLYSIERHDAELRKRMARHKTEELE